MAQTINTNIPSLNAQRNLTTSQSSLATSLQRLSSGLRINSAKDDAAGMAISSRMTSQINGLNQAARNANDGVSLAQTAEGAMAEISSNLQRIRELSVQSVNATNSSSDRVTMDAEVQALTAEIDRVAGGTAFNGVKLLDGTFAAQSFQVGANQGETISINSISSLRTAAMGATTSASITGSLLTGNVLAANEMTLTVNGVTTSVGAASNAGAVNGKGNTSAYSMANAINAVSAGVTATANATTSANAAAATGGAAIDAGSIQINGATITFVAGTVGTSAAADASAVASAINLQGFATTGVTATVDAVTSKITLTSAEGRNITTSVVTSTAGGLTAARLGLATSASTTAWGSVSLSSPNSITIGGTAPTNAGANLAIGSVIASTFNGTTVSQMNVLSAASANSAIATVDAALNTVNNARAGMGAIQNRFSSAVASLTTSSENLSAARSRIQDADFASETAALTRNQILQQAGIAMLAQANSLPQSVLSLLK